jgi:RNA polymerase sigma-70 factor, ECF subfamily
MTGQPPRDDMDAAILDLIKKGDYHGALRALMRAHGNAAYSFCLRIVKDASLAEDVQQKVFLQAYQGLATFGGASSLRTWLLGIARNRSIDALRARQREANRFMTDDDLLAEALAGGPGPGEQAANAQTSGALEECLDGCLSAEDKELVLLHFREGLSYEEMGALLGKKADTLRARVARALPKLRKCLETKGGGP